MIKRLVRDLLARRGLALQSIRSFNVFEAQIKKYLHPSFTFVQVGANDGKRFDPINKYVVQYQWRGLVIEPIQEYFDELCTTYRNQPQVECCKYAIFSEEKPVTLYRVNPQASLPEWTKGIASLDPQHCSKSETPASVMIAEEAQGIPLATLLRNKGLEKPDLIVIDTDGYDYHILKMIDLERNAPRLIRFEHGRRHQVMSREQLSDVIETLMGYNYDIFIERYDCVAAKRLDS